MYSFQVNMYILIDFAILFHCQKKVIKCTKCKKAESPRQMIGDTCVHQCLMEKASI